MTKQLDDLPADIYALFDPKLTHEPDEDNLNEFAETLKSIIRIRLAERENVREPLRFSNLGRPDRQIWFMAHPDGKEEELSSKTFFKFLYGDLIEALLLFLAKEAGHTVEREQEEVEVDGVKGHIDAVVDGVVVDVKSASPFGYKKFARQEVVYDDPFAYVAQLSGYSNVINPGERAAWLAMDKVAGDICVSPLSSSVIKDHKPEARIEHLKHMIEGPLPSLCHDPIPDGKSGNMKLPTPCSYCKFKRRCHPALRTFLYSTGPRYLTTVAKLPEVPEVRNVEIAEDEPA